jgi:hypothetical protein
VFAKEQWLIDTVRAELAQGRGVAVFCRQTGTRDIQPRIEKLLKTHLPLAKPFILKGNVCADRREEVLNRQIEMGTNILICNPRLVQTGLDLLDFPTIIFFEVDYSLYVVGQASRRAWRLIQDKPCKTFYPYYEGLMENQAVELVGLKQQAAGLLYGEETGGLSTLKSGGGGSLLAELAAEMGEDKEIADLNTLFARHAQTVDPTESAWFSAETVEHEVAIPPEPALELAQPVRDALGATAVDSTISETTQIVTLPPAQANDGSLSTPTKPAKRRKSKLRQVDGQSLLDLMSELPAPRLPILAEREAWKPISQDMRQLALF